VHATGYPLYLLLGKLFTYLPLGDVAYRVNLMSAVFAALSCGMVYGISLKLTRSWLVSLLGALFWGFSFYFWQSAVVAEVYALQTFLTGALILVLLWWDEAPSNRRLYLFAGLYGLSLGNHISGLLLALGFVYLVLSRRPSAKLRWTTIAVIALCFLAGLSIYLYLPLRYMADPPLNYVKNYYGVDLTTPQGLLWMVSGQMYGFFAFGYPIERIGAELLRYGGWLWRSFLGVGVPLGLFGLFHLFRRQRRWAIGFLLLLVPNVLFFANYRVVDKDTMFLPAHMIWALFIALGYMAIHHGWSRLEFPSRITIERRYVTGILITAAALLCATQAFTNVRWTNHSDRWQWRDLAEQVLAQMEPNAVIASQWSPAVVFEYLQLVEGQRPDVLLINRSRYSVAQFYHFWKQGQDVTTSLLAIDEKETSLLDALAESRPVYLVDVDPAEGTLDVHVYLPSILNNH
jgi:hypothetical protein